jgi:AraC-like DNA-binding protein
MSTHLPAIDLFLRGAAGGLLLFHLIHAWSSRLPLLQRSVLMAFEVSILAYLICSAPGIQWAPTAFWFVAFSLCFVAAPLLWLVAKMVFADNFGWTLPKTLLLMLAIITGWAETLGIGGVTVGAAHKLMLICFAAAALWTVAKDWQNDLVARRRWMRTWVTGSLAIYSLLVLSFELIFIRSAMPQGVMVLNLACITSIALATAVAFTRHPMDEWFKPGQIIKPTGTSAQDPDEAIHAMSTAQAESAAVASSSPLEPGLFVATLTPAPPPLNRRSALRRRLLLAMGEQRAYANEGLSLAQLALRLEATPAHLRETINEHLGYRNFHDFLHHYRIDEASQRLLTQDLPILSIALDVGYGSIGPFNRAFKQIKGVTPSEFRAQNSLSARIGEHST